MTISERLKKYLSIKGIGQGKFEKQAGLSNGYINSLKNAPGAEKLQIILGNAPDLNPDWLLTGKGEMLIGEDSTRKTDDSGLPLVPISAIGGALSGSDGQWMENEAERYIVPAFRKSDFLIRVEGDSMEPRYCRGDIVACTKVPLNDIWFQWGKVYVIDTKQGALIKRVEPSDNSDYILLVSDNERYKPFMLHKEELNGIALVNGLIRVE